MFKKIISFLISFFIFYTPVLANAASTKEKWNNARNQEIRNTIGQNATYGNNSGRITVRNYDATKKMVEASLSRSATVNGSKASVEAAVKVPVNMGKVAATTAKRLARGGVAGMLGGAAVQLLIDGVGWVMDPANNTIQKQTDLSNAQFYYQANVYKDITAKGVCSKFPSSPFGDGYYDANFGQYGRCVFPSYGNYFGIEKNINYDYDPAKSWSDTF